MDSDLTDIVTSQLVNLELSLPDVSESDDEDIFYPLLSVRTSEDRPYSQVLEELCLDFGKPVDQNN